MAKEYMTMISMSLPVGDVKALDSLVEKGDAKSRTDLIRRAVKEFLERREVAEAS